VALIEMLFNRTATIWRRDRTPDGQGGFPIGYVQVAAVRGRMRPASSGEQEIAAAQGRQITHVLYVLHGTDVARGDQVDIDGMTVEVQGVREPSRAGYHLEVDCRERQPEMSTVESGT
jgi:SPP1 family predicted phage head-tail adaptor